MEKELDQYKIRKDKLNKLISEGLEPFPSRVKRTHEIKDVLLNFERLQTNGKNVTIVGRLMSLRLHGGSLFANIEDGNAKIQIYIKKNIIGDKRYRQIVDYTDIGDFVEITGLPFITKKGEKTIEVKSAALLTKSLLPLPEKWHGLVDTEIRFRKRYLDLISNPEVKAIFKKRSLIVKAIREFLDNHKFLEVETPVLQSIPGGANAKPFKTHHNALNADLYLRIAPELYLKRLIVGGFERIYEISRCFRNEGVDFAHNPEFTQVEFYWAYADYEDLMKFTEKLISHIVRSVDMDLMVAYRGDKIDFNPPYQRITFREAVKKYAAIDLDKISKLKELKEKAKKAGVKIEKEFTREKIVDELFKKVVRSKLVQPTFVTDHPIEISPLSKKKKDNPKYTERFQFVVAGVELINAFSELNDPLDQMERFKNQEDLRKKGDKEAQRIDHEFIEALEYGMPPCAGFGMGIDRLTTILTGTHNIKEVILFPTLRNKNEKRRSNKPSKTKNKE